MSSNSTTNTAAATTPRMSSAQESLVAAVSQYKTIVLTSFKKDGTPVGTPVSAAAEAGRIFFRSYTKTGKFKRLRRNPRVEVTPSTLRGKPRGPTFQATARMLGGDDAATARRALARRHPVLQGMLVPATHKLLRYTTVHYEVSSGASACPSAP